MLLNAQLNALLSFAVLDRAIVLMGSWRNALWRYSYGAKQNHFPSRVRGPVKLAAQDRPCSVSMLHKSTGLLNC